MGYASRSGVKPYDTRITDAFTARSWKVRQDHWHGSRANMAALEVKDSQRDSPVIFWRRKACNRSWGSPGMSS